VDIYKAKLKEEYQKFLDDLSKEEYQKFLNAKSQEEFTDAKSREKYIKFLNAKSQVKFLDAKLQEEYQTRYNKLPDVKSKEEFLTRFDKLFEYLEKKTGKTVAEQALFEMLLDIDKYIKLNVPLPYRKEGYKNTLVFFEMHGGWEMMLHDIGKEATDLLHYFVQNY
jgi:phosphoenolpyruvate carboxylase